MERALKKTLVGGRFRKVPASHSRRMSAIRGKGNRTTEARFRAMLVRAGFRGWTMQTRSIKGKPDFYFPEQKVAIFLDGCYWHGCERCGHIPTVNRAFWKAKIERNQQRDHDNNAILAMTGFVVIRFWEHELSDSPCECIERLRATLQSANS